MADLGLALRLNHLLPPNLSSGTTFANKLWVRASPPSKNIFPHQPLNHQCSPSEVPLLFMEGCCPDPLWHLKIGQIINDRSEKYFDYHPLIMCWDSSNSLAVTGESVVFAILGMPCTSKTDEFLEKLQTAFDPPPLIFGKSYCNFFFKVHAQKAILKDPKSAL